MAKSLEISTAQKLTCHLDSDKASFNCASWYSPRITKLTILINEANTKMSRDFESSNTNHNMIQPQWLTELITRLSEALLWARKWLSMCPFSPQPAGNMIVNHCTMAQTRHDSSRHSQYCGSVKQFEHLSSTQSSCPIPVIWSGLCQVMSTNLKMSIQTRWTDNKSAELSASPETQQRYTCTNGRRGCSWFEHPHCGIPENCTIPEHTRFVVFPRGEVDGQAKVLWILPLSHTHQPHQTPIMVMIGSHHHETLDEIHQVSLFPFLGNTSLLHQSIIHAKPLNNQSSIRTYRHHSWNMQLIEFSYAWTSGTNPDTDISDRYRIPFQV